MNNKGFAITTILYGVLILFLFLLLSMLGILSSYKSNLEKLIESNNGAREILDYESNDLYDIVEIGDYIAYTGNNGCSGNYCSGWNAKQTGSSFGYCYNSNSKYTTYGWRVLYKMSNSVYIVSAGSPECVMGTNGNSQSTINSLESVAVKYCNKSYTYGGMCSYSVVHPFNGDDFFYFTRQYYGSSNARYLNTKVDGITYSSAAHCYRISNDENCGYGEDIIYNGGYYWFGSYLSSSSTFYFGMSFVNASAGSIALGVRPVIMLDSSIKKTGGSGTMTDPYTISERNS